MCLVWVGGEWGESGAHIEVRACVRSHPRQPTPQLVAGGQLPPRGAGGQFYPPTLLTGVKPSMRIWQEEVFGPVMCGKGPGV